MLPENTEHTTRERWDYVSSASYEVSFEKLIGKCLKQVVTSPFALVAAASRTCSTHVHGSPFLYVRILVEGALSNTQHFCLTARLC